MANIKISDLTAYTDPSSTDVLPIVDGANNVTKKVSVGDIVDVISGDVEVTATGASSIAAGVIVDADINASAAISGAKVQAGTTSNAGVVQLTDSTSSTSTATAATPNSVKSAYDLANAALPKSGGTMTGNVTFAGTQPTGTTSTAGIIQLTDSTSSTSTTTAATPNSVKTAYDLANAALPKAGGTLTGNVDNTATGYFDIPSGTTAQRPGSPNSGMIRYNSTTGQFEGYSSSWGALGGVVPATEIKAGIAEIATTAEVTAGSDDARIVTPLKLQEKLGATVVPATEAVSGIVELATAAETTTGTDATRATHPAGVKAAIDAAALWQKTGTTLAPKTAGDKALSSDVSFTQAGTGAVARTVDAKLKDVVSVKDFGAVGDGVTDDTAAIQAAIDHCISIGSYLLGSPGTYKISATLNLNCSGDLSAMTVRCPGATVSPAIQVGTTSGSTIFYLELTLPQVINSSKSGPGWSGFETSIGVDCGNLYDSVIRIPYVYGFGYNVYVGGHTEGNSYNEYTIGRLQEGKVGLRVAPRSVSGWANENNFYGGKLSKSSSEGTSTITGAYALQLGADPGQAWSCNNNVFFKPAVEDSGADEYQIVLNNTSYNTFVNARFEVTGGTGKVKLSADTLGTCSKNIFIGGYGLSNVVWTADANSVLNNVFGSSGHDVIDGSSSTAASLTLSNSFSSGETAPHITGFPSSGSVPLLNRDNADTSWIYRLHGSGISVKAAAATYPTLRLSQTGRLEFGQGVSDPTTHGAYLTAGNPGQLRSNANFQPSANNTYALGAGSLRWSTVYAATGTIDTSDERQKQDIADLDEAERRVAASLKGLIKKFRYKDAVELKGDDARIHVGVIAQDVIAAFKTEGLDPFRYGIVCYDEWNEERDEDGNVTIAAGNRYGIRYDELLAFVVSSL